MQAVIKLMRSKNLGLRVFVVVGATMYIARNFARNLRDQNGTLSKLEGLKYDFGPKENLVRV